MATPSNSFRYHRSMLLAIVALAILLHLGSLKDMEKMMDVDQWISEQTAVRATDASVSSRENLQTTTPSNYLNDLVTIPPTNVPSNNQTKQFELLCTAPRQVLSWGSFKIRCKEFKKIAEQCANVRVSIHSHKQIIHGNNMSLGEEKRKSAMKDFNATISVKTALVPLPRFGRIFVDIVDDFVMTSANLLPGNEVFVQSQYHGMDKFNDTTYYVVEHWYNSFPQDMRSTTPQFTIPTIQNKSILQMATIWNNQGHPCPKLSPKYTDIVYSCIDKPYGVGTWYKEFFKSANTSELERLDVLLQDKENQGPGRLYYEIFWKFDALIVPAKLGRREKLRYGNVQRAISQMRSGVPVLLEINGEVFQDFLIAHNYTCVFVTDNAILPLKMTRHIWSFDEAIEAMRSPEIRQKCQDEGLEIVKHYSPATIVEKELRIVGYKDEFDCSR